MFAYIFKQEIMSENIYSSATCYLQSIFTLFKLTMKWFCSFTLYYNTFGTKTDTGTKTDNWLLKNPVAEHEYQEILKKTET